MAKIRSRARCPSPGRFTRFHWPAARGVLGPEKETGMFQLMPNSSLQWGDFESNNFTCKLNSVPQTLWFQEVVGKT
jgi:hypothetical protein